jgi:hypothetical protein
LARPFLTNQFIYPIGISIAYIENKSSDSGHIFGQIRNALRFWELKNRYLAVTVRLLPAAAWRRQGGAGGLADALGRCV